MVVTQKEFYILTFPDDSEKQILLFFEDFNLAQIRTNSEIKFNKNKVRIVKVTDIGKGQFESNLVGIFSPNDDKPPEIVLED
jgi:hypothetical protein